MFLAAWTILLSMRASEDFGIVPNMLLASEDIKQKQNERTKRILGVLKIVCGWANKTWLLPYARCGLHFTDSAARVLSFYHSTPLHIGTHHRNLLKLLVTIMSGWPLFYSTGPEAKLFAKTIKKIGRGFGGFFKNHNGKWTKKKFLAVGKASVANILTYPGFKIKGRLSALLS